MEALPRNTSRHHRQRLLRPLHPNSQGPAAVPPLFQFGGSKGTLIPALPMVLYSRVWKGDTTVFDNVWPPQSNSKTILMLFIRGLAGSCAIILQFYSLQYVSMADSSVIAFSTPVFVSLASHVTLGERTGLVPISCGVITLLGVGVITRRPPLLTGGEEFDKDVLIGSALALASMFCSTANFFVLRYLRVVVLSVMTLFFGLFGTFQSLTLALAFKSFQVPQDLNDLLLAGALAGFTFIGQICLVSAFKLEQAGTVSLCRTCDILFAYLWQFLFLGIGPDLFSVIGGVIVILGVVLAGIRKFICELPPHHSIQKRFGFMLK